MILLPNGCRCSNLKVTPSNWNKAGASTKKDWYIYYRFYDPQFPKPYMVKLREFNWIKDLSDRRAVVKELMEHQLRRLKENSYNPITGIEELPDDQDYEIHPDTPFIQALRAALPKLDIVDGTRDDIKHIITGVEKAAKQLRYDALPISKVSRKHIKILLEWCGNNNKKWSNNRFNVYRAYLAMLFTELVELDAVTANPLHDIKKKKLFRKLRVVLSLEQRAVINRHLEEMAPRFHQYIHLFFHSGARGKELMQVRAKEVNLERQVYTTVIKKGKEFRQAERTIKDIALPYWKFFLEGAAPDQFLFGIDFQPAEKPMVPDTVGRWWKRLVKAEIKKGGLGISADLYSLKHSNTTETVDIAGNVAAAAQNGHLGTDMVDKFYDFRKIDRDHELRKKVNNPFA